MSPRIPENVSRAELSLDTFIRATRIPPRNPNDDDDDEGDEDDDTKRDYDEPAVIREPDDDE
jgi:hypothetical protein